MNASNMEKEIEKIYENTSPEIATLSFSPQNFISAGISCFSLILLDTLGLIDLLNKQGYLKSEDLKGYNSLIIITALKQLFKSKILFLDEDLIKFTDFGKDLLKYRGIMHIIYAGYPHVLANQVKYAKNNIKDHPINYDGISTGSNYVNLDFVDPILFDLLKTINFSGKVCDLGCGDGVRLSQICDQFGTNGIGIDVSKDAYNLAKKRISPELQSRITIQCQDVSDLSEKNTDVQLASQFFAFHDFESKEKLKKVLSNIHNVFPDLKYFVYCDTVGMGPGEEKFHPGFDYIHSLFGITPLTHSQLLETFQDSNFSISKEINIPNFPNTYLWLLEPNK